MIEIVIPKDIRKYEAKLIGPFTTRQVIFGSAAIITDLVVYKLSVGFIGSSSAFYLCFAIALPFILMMQKIYGMWPEQFLKSTFVSMFLAPKHRLYKIRNVYTKRSRFKKMDQKKYKSRMKKEKKLAKTNSDYERIA